MRVMVIGATGTLGHRLCLDWAERFECWGTVRAPVEDPVAELLAPARLIAGISAEEPDTLRSALERARPDVVVNCVGAVKQAEAGQQPIPAIRINSLFPHELAAACRESSARMIHVSTDCVFSGERGRYSRAGRPRRGRPLRPLEAAGRDLRGGPADPADLADRARAAIVAGAPRVADLEPGRERQGVLPSRLQRTDDDRASRAEIGALIEEHPGLEGIWHLASEPIDKLELLTAARATRSSSGSRSFRTDSVIVDRSLDSSRLCRGDGAAAPPVGPDGR